LKNGVNQGLGQVLSGIFDGRLFMAERSVKIARAKTVLCTRSFIFKKK